MSKKYYIALDDYERGTIINCLNGVFKRERLWFKAENVAENKRDVKRKLLNQGITFAKSLIATE